MTSEPRPISAAKRQGVIDAVLPKALDYINANGIEVTMNQVADAVGVSRSSLFRLFGSREALIAAAFGLAIDQMTASVPAFDPTDVEGSLRSFCQERHKVNMRTGPGFWVLASGTDLPPELVPIDKRRRNAVRTVATATAANLWRAAGGPGSPPKPFVATVGIHVSTHFTMAAVYDIGETWKTAAELAYSAIRASLREHLDATGAAL